MDQFDASTKNTINWMSAHQPKVGFENAGATSRKPNIDSCVWPLPSADFLIKQLIFSRRGGLYITL